MEQSPIICGWQLYHDLCQSIPIQRERDNIVESQSKVQVPTDSNLYVCQTCQRPFILEDRIVHSCRLDNAETASVAWSKQSAVQTSIIWFSFLLSLLLLLLILTTTTHLPLLVYLYKDALDLDRHCSVIIAPSGVPCMRSLSCKSHSMASKRAVIGRSKDFDTLLAEYLVANPARNQSAMAAVSVVLEPSDLHPSDKPTQSTIPVTDCRLLQRHSTVHTIQTGNYFPSRETWLSRNTKMWLSEPLRIYAASRKASEQTPTGK